MNDIDTTCVGDYNKDLMDPGLFVRRITLVSLQITSFLLSILSFKWRNLGNSFVYLECAIIIMAALIPNGFNYSQDRLSYLWTHVTILVCLYTGKVGQIIMVTISLLFHEYFILHVAYKKDLNPVSFFFTFALVLGFFFSCLVGNMVLLYIIN